ncbi:hypothetical protein P7C70_g9075, partial [Phenoliferia sp. Uapishka_3]
SERGARGGRGRGRGGAGSWGTRDDEDGRDVKRAKVAPTSGGDNSDPDSSSDSDSDSDDDSPPVASSSKVPVEGLFDLKASVEPTAPTRALEGGGRPTIHPSRIQAATEEPRDDAAPPTKEFQVVCKHWRKGNCAQGDNCPFLHSVSLNLVQDCQAFTDFAEHTQLPPNSTTPAMPPKRKRPAPPALPYNPFARSDPFAQLAERDIAHVVSDALYALEFFYQNDWLKGVEARVGELDEEGGIEELAEAPPKIDLLLPEAEEEAIPDTVEHIIEDSLEYFDGSSGDELEISKMD